MREGKGARGQEAASDGATHTGGQVLEMDGRGS